MSQKVKVCRTSGLPIKHEDNVRYNEEFTQVYDRVLTKLNINTSEIMSPETSERMNKLLTRCQRLLLRKYPVVAEWPMLKTQAAWIKVIKQYGPVVCAISRDTQELAYVILDESFIVE